MTRPSILILLLALTVLSASSQISFTGNSNQVIKADVPASTGLSSVYVMRNSNNTTVVYRASSPSANVTVSTFGNMGAAYAETIAINRNGDEYSFPAPESDLGYVITENDRPTYFYIINYDRHALRLETLTHSAIDSDCARIALILSGNAAPIPYYSINGRRMELSRDLTLAYTTLSFDENSEIYVTENVTENLSGTTGTIHVNQPLCATSFTLSGDRFLEAWNDAMEVSSNIIEPVAVDAKTSAIQTTREVDNEQKVDANLGGSAPVDITFTASVTDAAIFHEWQFASDPEFDIIDLRFNDLKVDYTFHDAGTTYVRFVAANSDASCEYYSETYEVFIGESRLECPNAFSPRSTPGINDEWKVSYKSITSFECHIFNRWGVKVATLNHPSQGWDGRHNGKLVPAGVYFYVIKATGADGHKYNLSGDINILNSKDNKVQSSTPDA